MSPPVIGLGHSLGAVTTYIAAAKYPQLFSCIILLDPPILPRRTIWLITTMKWLGLAGKIPLARTARRRKKTFA
jgi:pimeloyl-ACP methyl ester carboxylesterase